MSNDFDFKAAPCAAAVLVLALLALALPAAAAADDDCVAAATDPTAAQYCPSTTVTVPDAGDAGGAEGVAAAGGEGAPSGEPVATSGGGTLPLTGTDLFALGAVAGAFLAASLALRRLSHAPGAD